MAAWFAVFGMLIVAFAAIALFVPRILRPCRAPRAGAAVVSPARPQPPAGETTAPAGAFVYDNGMIVGGRDR